MRISPGFTITLDREAEELVLEGVDHDPNSATWAPEYRVIARIPLTSVSLTSLKPILPPSVGEDA